DSRGRPLVQILGLHLLVSFPFDPTAGPICFLCHTHSPESPCAAIIGRSGIGRSGSYDGSCSSVPLGARSAEGTTNSATIERSGSRAGSASFCTHRGTAPLARQSSQIDKRIDKQKWVDHHN